MDILKKILKITLFVSLVLAIGQVQMGQRTLGGHFVSNVENGTRWSSRQLIEAKFMEGIPVPDFLVRWVKEKEVPKKPRAEAPVQDEGDISRADREAMLHLLEE